MESLQVRDHGGVCPSNIHQEAPIFQQLLMIKLFVTLIDTGEPFFQNALQLFVDSSASALRLRESNTAIVACMVIDLFAIDS